MVKLAHRFDTVTEQIITDNMCTDVCPCLDYDTDVNGMPMSTKELYNLIKEERMNLYGRTNSYMPPIGLE